MSAILGAPLPVECPFCGSPNIELMNGNPPIIEWMECGSCGAHGPTAAGVEDPIEFWNNRIPIDQEAANRIARKLV